jgi:hypothetical protein
MYLFHIQARWFRCAVAIALQYQALIRELGGRLRERDN